MQQKQQKERTCRRDEHLIKEWKEEIERCRWTKERNGLRSDRLISWRDGGREKEKQEQEGKEAQLERDGRQAKKHRAEAPSAEVAGRHNAKGQPGEMSDKPRAGTIPDTPAPSLCWDFVRYLSIQRKQRTTVDGILRQMGDCSHGQ